MTPYHQMVLEKKPPELRVDRESATYRLENWEELDQWARHHIASYQQASCMARAWGVSEPDRLRLIIGILVQDLTSLRELYLSHCEACGPLPVTGKIVL